MEKLSLETSTALPETGFLPLLNGLRLQHVCEAHME